MKVLVAEDDAAEAKQLISFLDNHGFQCRYANTGVAVRTIMKDWSPDYIIVDLTLREGNALELLRELQGHFFFVVNGIKVIVLSKHNRPENVRECLRYGAADYLAKPYKLVEILARMVLHSQQRRELKEFSSLDRKNASAGFFLYLTELALKESNRKAPVKEILHNLTRMAGMATQAVRVSLYHCDMENREGSVWASSDRPKTDDLRIQLNKYPEVLYVLNHRRLLALENLSNDPTMGQVSLLTKDVHFDSMIVCPVPLFDEVPFVLSVRLPDAKLRLRDDEIRFSHLIAQICGQVILRFHPELAQPAGKSAA